MGRHFFGITDKGKRRTKNEDTFFVKESAGGQFIVACVIDGVGGYQGGDVAAAITRSVMMKSLETVSGNVIEQLQQAIITANEKIQEGKKLVTGNAQMACVLTCAVIDTKNNKLWYAHVGDTRIYLWRDHSLVKISKDHSAVGFLEESGRLSEQEAMHHPRRNEINKALGFEEDLLDKDDFIETGDSPFLPGDIILLCSDGLTDMIGSNSIAGILHTDKKPEEKAKALINAANDAGGNDNITAVLVEHNKQPQQKLQPVTVEKKTAKELLTVTPDTAGTKNKTGNTKKRSRLIVLLTLIVTGILLTAITVAFNRAKPKVVMPAKTTTQKSEQFLQLLSHINDSSKTYSLPEKGIVIPVTSPVSINKDSFYLKGNGSVLVADSMQGPALIINRLAKKVTLDSIVLENFDVGILVEKNNVTLKNVRFINCRVPVQYAVSFTDSLVSGTFKDSIFTTQKLK